MTVVHLVDLLDEVETLVASPGRLELQHMDVDGEQRTAIFQHPLSRVRFPLPPGSAPGRLSFAIGIRTRVQHLVTGAVRFRLLADANGGGDPIALWDAELDPARVVGHRRWVDHVVDLPPIDALLLETTARDIAYAWAGWADPTLRPRMRPAVRPRPARSDQPAPVLLITADGLRADAVADPSIATPNIDALATDGLRFEEARTQSSTTPGAYASLLTGLGPRRHGIVSEWGTLPRHLPSLPLEFARTGRHTLFAPSEDVLARAGQGFAPLFAECLACLGNPSQDGAVTTRRLLARTSELEPRALFVWAHYFDAHPPRPMAAELVDRHYDGDPRDPGRTFKAKQVCALTGIEMLLYVRRALPALRSGRVDARLLARLRATSLALQGRIDDGPDLVDHLRNLGAEVVGVDDLLDVATFLEVRTGELEAGHVSPDIAAWLEALPTWLAEIDRELVGWLDGIVDLRYLIAHAHAAVEHVDAQVGALVDDLRERGVYDRATVVVTAPHGELWDDPEAGLNHHSLDEDVLRIPLVIKPPDAAGVAPAVVRGGFDLVDLMPTLVQLAGEAAPSSCDGAGRLPELRSGDALQQRPSFALGSDAADACMALGDTKLIRTYDGVVAKDGSWTAAGTSDWVDLARGEARRDPPADAARWERALDEWTGRSPGSSRARP